MDYYTFFNNNFSINCNTNKFSKLKYIISTFIFMKEYIFICIFATNLKNDIYIHSVLNIEFLEFLIGISRKQVLSDR